MTIDLSRLEYLGKTAVRCTSEDETKIFMEAMWTQYPHLVSGIWRKGQTNWERHDDKREIYYLPRIVRDPEELNYCQSSSLSTREREKYTVVEFEDLLVSLDFGELSVAESDIKILFDMG